MAPMHQVRVFTLKYGEDSQHKLYRLEKGWTLRFVLGPSLMALPVRLFSNHPPDKATPYDRNTFYEVEWKTTTGNKADRTDEYAELRMILAGSFNFFFTVNNSDKGSNRNGSGHFLVDPTLQLGPNKDEIKLDSIVCQTVITKLLGPFEEWLPRLQVSAETGYNMVHFTPVQELGISNSAYSIRDQLVLSPVYSPGATKYTLDDVEKLMQHMNEKLGLMSLSDLVYNHTAKDSPWVWKHPECTFNMANSPHLRPAYVVDRILEHFSLEVGAGEWEAHGIPKSVNSEDHLNAISHVLHTKVFPKYRLQEFFCIHIDDTMKDFNIALSVGVDQDTGADTLNIIQDPQYRRLKSTVDMKTACKLYRTESGLRERLQQLNTEKENEMQDHINSAISNFVANARWRFVTSEGPRIPQVIPDEPLMFGYFVIAPSHEGTVESEEGKSYEDGAHIMAVNGWVMGDDPLRNFAAPGRTVYLRRELMAWGDSVKLNYGDSREDCPYLWDLMAEYTKVSARLFQGLRLDNCHSTPIHVAEYMLDIARKVRPDLYVIAELFTGSEGIDNLFMNRLGINSLIRESLVAWNSHEQGRLVHRFGGDPVGAFIQPRVRPLEPRLAHALFFDQTHDNECPIHKRSAYDIWPTAAMVAISNCAVGSNRGYDEMVPVHISVVTEERLYRGVLSEINKSDKSGRQFTDMKDGIAAGKRSLNRLHFLLAAQGFSQVYVDQVDPDTVSVTRHNPLTHESVVLVARTAFNYPWIPEDKGNIRPIVVQGAIEEVLLEGRMVKTNYLVYQKDPDYLNGLTEYTLQLRENFPVEQNTMVRTRQLDTEETEVSFTNFTPGSVIAFKCSLPSKARGAILEIRRGLGQFGYMMRSYSGNSLMFQDQQQEWDTSNFRHIVARLTLADLNRCLFRIDQEERDDGYGFGAYNIPGAGDMVYCGLRGVVSMLANIRPHNDLGHALCGSLRDGDWLADYIAGRLKAHEGPLRDLGNWFGNVFDNLKRMPRFLIPCYFDAVVTGAYMILLDTAYDLMADFIRDGSNFVKALSMTSLQVVGFVPQAVLPQLSPALAPPPRTEWNNRLKKVVQAPLSISAGFPHFGAGYMRNWGRDTFIALRGLLLVTGRQEDARHIILAYAGTLRHGLIPNLLNEGNSRYNCRDAVWFWLLAVREYCTMVEGGHRLLTDPVSRLYPRDDSEKQEAGSCDQPLHEVMQEALSVHAAGRKFRERNAGHQIDDQMTSEGFNNSVCIDWKTGFPTGGNEWNCGTWMDKMGSSEKAGNKGKPATPRDGSAVELVGLCAGTVQWLAQAHSQGIYPHDGVLDDQANKVTFQSWFDLLKSNFERHFLVSPTPGGDEPRPDLINRRGIYKDSVGASQVWADYQLRCNFPIAMVACPDLFTPDNAWLALENAGRILLGPLGMKTLDPSDWNYRGDYDNDNDSTDISVAKGWNYHQGPEWVWPVGYFLRAKLYFASRLEAKKPGLVQETKLYVNSVMSKHYAEILASPWQGLPELTNSNGAYCEGSCRTQAWSAATVLEVMHDLFRMDGGQ